YALLSLYGAVSVALAEAMGAVVFGFAILAAVAMVLTGQFLRVTARQDFGITSTVAALLTVTLGALAASGQITVAVALAVVAAGVLSLKPVLHRWIRLLETRELYSVLQLLLISVVVLPILPDRGYGPWKALNPYELWWMVVLISAISFAGYFSIKLLGARRGLGWAALLGGLVSSTAVTVSYSRMGQVRRRLSHAVAYGILLACGTMFARVLLIAAIINREIALALSAPLAAMAAACYVSSWWQWRRVDGTGRCAGAESPPGTAVAAGAFPPADEALPSPELDNPFQLRAAIQFAVLLAAILLASKALESNLGDAGIYLLSAISGLADVDPVTLSLGRMAPADITNLTAAAGILLATCTNTVVKGVLSWTIGGASVAGNLIPGLLLALAVGAVAGYWRHLFGPLAWP
ncbi:MAG: MgtC/SapB family protein, partial [Gammaproteobacteria bacterium]